MMTATVEAWMKYDSEDDEDPTYEAQIKYPDEDLNMFTVEWYHSDVGQVTSRFFKSLLEARSWLVREGFVYVAVFE